MLVYDGNTWYARIFIWSHKHWKCVEEISAVSEVRDSIPTKILDFAKRNKAKRVRVLRPAEMHQVELQLPADIEPEEIHTAISSQIENEADLEPGAARFASVKINQFGLGGHSDAIVSTSFGIEIINKYKAQCAEAKLTFDGIGSVELASLACQARLEPNARFLIMRENESFYVCPESNNAPFFSQTFTFGVTPDTDSQRDQDRLDRAAKTFRRSTEHIHIWATSELSNNRKAQIQEAFTDDAAIEYIHFSERVTQLATHATWHNNHGNINSGCALIDAPKKAKSPYRSGTWLMFAILLFSLAGMFLIYHKNKASLDSKKEQIAKWEERLALRKKLSAKLKVLRTAQSKSRKTVALMKQPTVSKELITILYTLAKKHPEDYTRIYKITQVADRKFKIEGMSPAEKTPTLIASILEKALGKYGLTYNFEILEEKNKISLVKHFVGKVEPAGGSN